jgi:plasmid stabilization system protein ParE
VYQLIIRPYAIKMAENAYQWYEEQQNGLGDLFLLELENCYDKLVLFPVLYNKVRKDFRQIILKKFPYVVVYKIIEEKVVVYSVFHTSRNPRKKFKNL